MLNICKILPKYKKCRCICCRYVPFKVADSLLKPPDGTIHHGILLIAGNSL